MSTTHPQYELYDALRAIDSLAEDFAILLGVVALDMDDLYDDKTVSEEVFHTRLEAGDERGSHANTLYAKRFGRLLVERILGDDAIVLYPAPAPVPESTHPKGTPDE